MVELMSKAAWKEKFCWMFSEEDSLKGKQLIKIAEKKKKKKKIKKAH